MMTMTTEVYNRIDQASHPHHEEADITVAVQVHLQSALATGEHRLGQSQERDLHLPPMNGQAVVLEVDIPHHDHPPEQEAAKGIAKRIIPTAALPAVDHHEEVGFLLL